MKLGTNMRKGTNVRVSTAISFNIYLLAYLFRIIQITGHAS